MLLLGMSAVECKDRFLVDDVNVHDGHDCVHDLLMNKLGGDDHHRRTMSLQDYGMDRVPHSAEDDDIPQTDAHDKSRSKEGSFYEAPESRPAFESKQENPHRRLQITWGAIRIFVDTSRLEGTVDGILSCYTAGAQYLPTISTSSSTRGTCSGNDVLTTAKKDYLVNIVLKETLDFFRDSLSVIPVVGNLTLTNPMPTSSCFNDGFGIWYSFMCCQGQAPASHSSPGLANTDFVIYITTRPTSGSTIAWALTCQSDQNSRPIAGHANFSPSRISTLPQDKDLQLSTAIHEIAHALGFSSSKFSSFRQSGTNIPIPYSSVVGTFFENGHNIKRIITPTVVAKIKEHFDCTDWSNAGGELEEFGGSGTAGSHWEKRVFNNEFMTGTADIISAYSAITIGLFKDTGWYEVSYTKAQILPWGYRQGCGFPRDKCSTWSSKYFCTVPNADGCTADQRFRAQCNLGTSSSALPSYFQYFTNPNDGGTYSYMDYCPVYMLLNDGDCMSATTAGYWFFGEAPGSTSRCFSGSYQRSTLSKSPAQHSGCLKMQCTTTNNLNVKMIGPGGAETVVNCPLSGGTVDVGAISGSAFVGTIDCPPSYLFCTGNPCDVLDCSGHGTCVSLTGTCTCHVGYYGDTLQTCDKKLCPKGGVNNTQCSSNALCNSALGRCENGDGLPGCYAGYKDTTLGAGDCALAGCPSAIFPACPGGGACECAGHGNCTSGICVCPTGFIGGACDLEDCQGSPRCNGASQGVCDANRGLCVCRDEVNELGSSFHFKGSDCGTRINSTRNIIPLNFVGETNDNGTYTYEPWTGILPTKEYNYFQFVVPSTTYPIELRVRVTDPFFFDMSKYSMVASYATAGRPSLASKQFAVSSIDATTKTQVLKFTPSAVGSEGSFNKNGLMYIAVISYVNIPVQVNLTRDGCALLVCKNNATCLNGRCACARTNEPGSTTRTFGWSGPDCGDVDCPGTPDCGGSRGVCIAPKTSAEVPKCVCSSLFAGAACENYNVSSVTRVVGSTTQTMPSQLSDFVNDGQGGVRLRRTITLTVTGTIEVGNLVSPILLDPANLQTCCQLNGTFAIYARLNVTNWPKSASDGVPDPMLLSRRDNQPTLSSYHAFDKEGWTSRRRVHELSVTSRDDAIYFISVTNGRYATARLVYSLYIEVTTGGCPQALNNCNNNGVAVSCDGTCQCADGWEGIRCDVPAPTIQSMAPPLTIDPLAPGDWKYLVHKINDSTTEIEVTMTRLNHASALSPRAQPLMVVAFDSARSVSSISRLTSELAMFDFDSYTSSLSSQGTVVTTSSGQSALLSIVPLNARSQKLFIRRTSLTAHRYLYIGIQNTPLSKIDAAVNLTLVARDNSTLITQCPTPGSCDKSYCNQRGSVSIGSTSTFCLCDSGWNDDSRCASPRFSSFSKFSEAAQNIDILCSLCKDVPTLGKDEIAFYRVPQVIQEGTGLKFQVSPSTSNVSSNTTSRRLLSTPEWARKENSWWPAEALPQVHRNLQESRELSSVTAPSILVSENLPRSIIDFTTIVSNGTSQNRTVVISRSSPTGSYWVAVYSNTEGTYLIETSRDSATGVPPAPEDILGSVKQWLLETSSGRAVLGMGSSLIACVVGGCLFSYCSCGGNVQQKISEDETRSSLRLKEWQAATGKSARSLHMGPAGLVTVQGGISKMAGGGGIKSPIALSRTIMIPKTIVPTKIMLPSILPPTLPTMAAPMMIPPMMPMGYGGISVPPSVGHQIAIVLDNPLPGTDGVVFITQPSSKALSILPKMAVLPGRAPLVVMDSLPAPPRSRTGV